jgi:hypothetical protein
MRLQRSLFPEPLDFHFKWADHPAGEGHIHGLEKGGDTAPNFTNISVIPEPSTISLAAAGVVGLVSVRRRRATR